MKSTIVKRSVVIAGHKTSVSLEEPFWTALKQIAAARGMFLCDLVASIEAGRQHANLSSAIRLFVLDFYKSQLDLQAFYNTQLGVATETETEKTEIENMPVDPAATGKIETAGQVRQAHS
jgi:predicted DNA-binding ribbon-helix-helix protein